MSSSLNWASVVSAVTVSSASCCPQEAQVPSPWSKKNAVGYARRQWWQQVHCCKVGDEATPGDIAVWRARSLREDGPSTQCAQEDLGGAYVVQQRVQ